jgi:inorganic pyrophosphatase
MHLTAAAAVVALLAQTPIPPPHDLPPAAVKQLIDSIAAAKQHARHVWRDTPPFNADGTVNGYVEIPRGERRKFEFSIRQNRRAIDRVMPRGVGGYPVNYGFVPQTISYDGDPFDILLLGPALPGGRLVRGKIVGLMHMEDEKGWDSKVVVSPLGRDGRPLYRLTPADQRRIGEYFKHYKEHEPGKFSRVPGWDGPVQGRAYVETTHAFYRRCGGGGVTPCRVGPD